MANYEINLTATQIEAALNKAHAPSTVVDSTQNLVESGAIKTYVDTQVSAGASITTASFAGSALEDSTEGITATDTAIPTSKAVKDEIVSSQRSLGSYTTIGASGTATTDGFIVAVGTPDEYDSFIVRVAGIDFFSRMSNNDGKTYTVTVPIAAGMSWAISGGGSSGNGSVKKFIPLS